MLNRAPALLLSCLLALVFSGTELALASGTTDAVTSSSSSTPMESSSSSTSAAVESSSSSTPLPFSTPSPAICGDGKVEYPETCDDGNVHNFDGCSSVCTIEAGWNCSRPANASASICNLIMVPQWTGLTLTSGATYTGMTNNLIISLFSNFPFRNGSNISIIGLNVTSTNENYTQQQITVLLPGISSQAMFWQSEGKLTIFVTEEVQVASFTIQVINPSYARQAIPLGAECTGCVSYDPSYSVINRALTEALAVKAFLPASCGDNKYGSGCKYTCSTQGGIISGYYCICNPGWFGLGCSQTLGVATQKQKVAVDPTREATIQGSGGLSVVLPAGAVDSSVVITVSVYNITNLNVEQGSSQNLEVAGSVVMFQPSGQRFNKYINITLPYDPSKIASGKEAFVFYYNQSALGDPWVRQVTQAYQNNSPPVLVAQINHFSMFVPLGATPLSTNTPGSSPSNSNPGSPSSNSPSPSPTLSAGSGSSVYGAGLLLTRMAVWAAVAAVVCVN
eukprot:760421-Hanusia_phi.AAC.2